RQLEEFGALVDVECRDRIAIDHDHDILGNGARCRRHDEHDGGGNPAAAAHRFEKVRHRHLGRVFDRRRLMRIACSQCHFAFLANGPGPEPQVYFTGPEETGPSPEFTEVPPSVRRLTCSMTDWLNTLFEL